MHKKSVIPVLALVAAAGAGCQSAPATSTSGGAQAPASIPATTPDAGEACTLAYCVTLPAGYPWSPRGIETPGPGVRSYFRASWSRSHSYVASLTVFPNPLPDATESDLAELRANLDEVMPALVNFHDTNLRQWRDSYDGGRHELLSFGFDPLSERIEGPSRIPLLCSEAIGRARDLEASVEARGSAPFMVIEIHIVSCTDTRTFDSVEFVVTERLLPDAEPTLTTADFEASFATLRPSQ